VGTTVSRTLETLPYVWLTLSPTQKEVLFPEDVVYFWNDLTKSIASSPKQFVQSIAYDKASESFLIESKLFIYP